MSAWFDAILNSQPGHVSRTASTGEATWRSLRLFLIYRILLALALLFFFYSPSGPGFLGRFDPVLYGFTAVLYVGLTLISALFWYWGSPSPHQQTYLILLVDILAITLLMHASGGIESGLGMLLAVSISGGSTQMGGRPALLFAAFATLAILIEQIYADYAQLFPIHFPQAGFLGAVFFATAILTMVLGGRARASEELAAERQQELGSLARLNEYIIQHMQTGVLAVDEENRILLMNDPAWRLLGMPEAHAGSQLRSASPELDRLVAQWRRQHRSTRQAFRAEPQGPRIRTHIRPLGVGRVGDVLLFLEDDTQIQREAQQMKLASLGRLTASIAHEIRNPLGAISHASQLFDESPELDPGDRRLTEIIKTNADRVNRVIENVLQLSRRKPGNPTAIRLKPWLERLLADLVKTQGFDPSSLHLQIEPADLRIFADTEQLRQVVTNLCNNAREHHPDRARLQINLVGGRVSEFNHPLLDIIDNGPGIPPDVARQIFEPFYTTRNEGTGLGLYIAKELCETNQIRLEYIPGPTGGSCFRLHFTHLNEEITAS